MDAEELVALADELYAVDLTGFTAARDAAAVRLKKDDPTGAAEVKRLRKPTLAAWALGQFVRREGEQVDSLLALGESLREAQEALDGAELRALTTQRRQLVRAMTQRVRALSHQAGHPISPTVAEQVESTLNAALLDAEVGRAFRSGMLVTAVRSTGVEAVDVAGALALPSALGFTPVQVTAERVDSVAPAVTKLRVVPDPDAAAKRRRAARQELAEAERVVAKALREQRARKREFAALEARALQTQARIDEVRRTLAELEDEADQVDTELAEAEVTLAECEEAVERAESVRDDARAELASLE